MWNMQINEVLKERAELWKISKLISLYVNFLLLNELLLIIFIF